MGDGRPLVTNETKTPKRTSAQYIYLSTGCTGRRGADEEGSHYGQFRIGRRTQSGGRKGPVCQKVKTNRQSTTQQGSKTEKVYVDTCKNMYKNISVHKRHENPYKDPYLEPVYR